MLWITWWHFLIIRKDSPFTIFFLLKPRRNFQKTKLLRFLCWVEYDLGCNIEITCFTLGVCTVERVKRTTAVIMASAFIWFVYRYTSHTCTIFYTLTHAHFFFTFCFLFNFLFPILDRGHVCAFHQCLTKPAYNRSLIGGRRNGCASTTTKKTSDSNDNI